MTNDTMSAGEAFDHLMMAEDADVIGTSGKSYTICQGNIISSDKGSIRPVTFWEDAPFTLPPQGQDETFEEHVVRRLGDLEKRMDQLSKSVQPAVLSNMMIGGTADD